MDRRPLGRTGLDVSMIGYGAFKIGRNEGIKYPTGYELPSEEAAARILNGVLDLGINLIDTAPAYGLSEERIGRALATRRGEFILSTKVGETFIDGQSTYDFSRDAVLDSIEQSLQRLQTDVVDLLLVHSDGRDLAIQRETDLIETLQSIRAAGKARFIGFSGKSTEGAREAMDWADVLMVEFNAAHTNHAPVVRDAAARGIGILVKKGLGSGTLSPEDAIPFVLREPGVSSLVVGGLSLEHLRENVRIASHAE